jgi:cytochrome c oxidase assembly protein subunit 15
MRVLRLTVSPRVYALVAWGALAALALIVFSGAGVRLTGSGLGCPDWPRCGGTFLPELSLHVFIEYGNRVLSAMVGVVSLAAGVLVFRRRPFRRDLVRPAVVLPLGVLGQGALGAATVLLDLSWPVVIAHYLLSMVLLVAAVVLVWRVHRAEGEPAPAMTDRLIGFGARALVAYGGLVIVAGTFATAAGPHAGGAGTGDVVGRLDVWGAGTLRTVIQIHGHMAAVLGFAAVMLWAWGRGRDAPRRLMAPLTAVCLLIATQGTLGLIGYHSALPAGVVWAHAALPAVLWSTLVWSWLAAGRPVTQRTGSETRRLRTLTRKKSPGAWA